MKNPAETHSYSNRFFTTFTPLYWLAILAALFLWSRDWAIVRATSTSQEHLFGLFGLCAFCAVAVYACVRFKAQTAANLRTGLLIGLPILVSLFFLALTVELSKKSWDYEQYETAFRALVDGSNPYASTRYLYPPFFAQTMVYFYGAAQWVLPALGMAARESSLWTFVFYIHQSALFYTLLLCYELSLRFAERIGLRPLKGTLIVSALFLFNVPLLRTLSYNQVNFYILASVLLAMLWLERHAVAAGMAIAVGGLVKLYPFALVAPLLATKKWRALAGVVLGVAVIAAVQTRFFRDLTLWKQFVLFYTSFPDKAEGAWFRNSSPLSLLRNLVEFSGLPSGLAVPVFGVVVLAIAGWFGLRFLQRERSGDATVRLFGHLLDFSALSLLVAPLAWEHHYVIAMPLAIWVFARRRDAFRPALIGAALVFLLPVFNAFPFSYLRLAGLVVLLVLASPKRIGES